MVRNSSQKGLYTLSLYTKVPQSQVKHYHIKQNPQGFFLSEKHCCATIPELIKYHSFNAGGLACRLKSPPGRCKPPTAGLAHGKWEIDPTELVRAKILYAFKKHDQFVVFKYYIKSARSKILLQNNA